MVVKVLLWGVGSLIVLAIFGVWWINSRDEDYRDEQHAVSVAANYAPDRCSAVVPVRVTVTNGAKRTLREMTFTLSVYEHGRSEDLAPDSYVQWKTILDPGETRSSCFSWPQDRAAVAGGSLTIRATRESVDFYADGSYVPPH